MKIEIVMPQMGESITEGTVSKWLKKAGDNVKRDEAILEISTDKVDTEIPSPGDGVLAEIVAEEGEAVEVGKVLAYLETKDTKTKETEPAAKEKGRREEKDAKKAEEIPSQEEDEREEEREKDEGREEVEAERGRGKQKSDADTGERRKSLSPVVRNIIEKEGLTEEEVKSIEGTGHGGRLTKADLLGFLEKRKKSPEAVDTPSMTFSYDADGVVIETMSPMRKKIAEHMVFSKRVSPHVYTAAEVDLTRIVNFREKVKEEFERREGFKLTYTPFILFAAVQALKKWPIVNASVDGDKIIRKKYINLGVAVALEGGLIVPVIKGADEKNLLGLARAVQDLGRRAREKRLKPDDVRDGTFTVTNPGIFGNIFGLAVINQPQVAILNTGAVKKRTVVIDDAIAIRSMMFLTLSYDHRIIDGAVAAQFVQEIVRHLQEFKLEGLF